MEGLGSLVVIAAMGWYLGKQALEGRRRGTEAEEVGAEGSVSPVLAEPIEP
jgi:hypothetical protein